MRTVAVVVIKIFADITSLGEKASAVFSEQPLDKVGVVVVDAAVEYGYGSSNPADSEVLGFVCADQPAAFDQRRAALLVHSQVPDRLHAAELIEERLIFELECQHGGVPETVAQGIAFFPQRGEEALLRSAVAPHSLFKRGN